MLTWVRTGRTTDLFTKKRISAQRCCTALDCIHTTWPGRWAGSMQKTVTPCVHTHSTHLVEPNALCTHNSDNPTQSNLKSNAVPSFPVFKGTNTQHKYSAISLVRTECALRSVYTPNRCCPKHM